MAAFPSSSFITDNMVQGIDDEWMSLLGSEFLTSYSDENERAVRFWKKVRDAKSGNEDPFFPLLSNFMLNLLCLPHSSATVERVFSAVNRLKTKLRNRLATETLNGVLHTKRFLSKSNCYDVSMNKSLLNKFSSMYKKAIAKDTGESDED